MAIDRLNNTTDPALPSFLPTSLTGRLPDAPIQSPLQHWDSPGGFQDVLAAHYTLPGIPSPGGPLASRRYCASIPSESFRSMGPFRPPTGAGSTFSYDLSAPSLDASASTATTTSLNTGAANQLNTGVTLLEEASDGALQLPQTGQTLPVFYCAFIFLGCNYLSPDEEEWKTHCFSHFCGENPPRSVQCPLCEHFKGIFRDGRAAWEARLEHVARAHHDHGHSLGTARPDFELFYYLWQKRIIDDADYKELKGGNHTLSRCPAPFTVTEGRHAERRRGRPRQSHARERRNRP